MSEAAAEGRQQRKMEMTANLWKNHSATTVTRTVKMCLMNGSWINQ